ncbi:hypothetical protein [Mesorhizobium sp.]|uniref:hypothetical protein n=1 Tax=Mesorhizobium sp. TaxID=1871066 RepID=UPI0025FA8BBF|nr:hypothetical protein [Mesorhizobium sp.]
MAIDQDFFKKFEDQILVLEGIEKAVQEGIRDAKQKLDRIKKGESMDEVFGVPPKK